MGFFSSLFDKAKGVLGKVAQAVTTVAPIAKGVLGKVSSIINNPTVQGFAKGLLGGKAGAVLGKVQELIPKATGLLDKAEPIAKKASEVASSSTPAQALEHAKGLLPRNLKLNF